MADLTKIKVRDCELSVRTINTIGGDTTLAQVAGMSDEAMKLGGLTRKSIRELREVVDNPPSWPEDEVTITRTRYEKYQACEATLLWISVLETAANPRRQLEEICKEARRVLNG